VSTPVLSRFAKAITTRIATHLDAVAPQPSAPAPASVPAADAPAPPPTSARLYWQQSAERLRQATRWVLAVFGAIGVVFLGALPFSGLTNLEPDSPEAALTATGIILLVGGLSLVLRAGSEVFISRAGSLTDFDAAWTATSDGGARPFGLSYARYEILNGLAEDTAGLIEAWEQARLQKWRTASAAVSGADDASDPRRRLARLAAERFAEIDAQTDYVMGLASYRRVLRTYRTAQSWLFVGATLVALGGALYFFAVDEKSAPIRQAGTFSVVASTDPDGDAGCEVTRSDSGVEVAVPRDRVCVVEEVGSRPEDAGRGFPAWVASWQLPLTAFLLIVLLLLTQTGHFKYRFKHWPRTKLFD
jgi:hypothetical protein